MEAVNLFLFMGKNHSIVTAVGKSGLILDDLGFEIIDHPVAHGKMCRPDNIAQKIAAVLSSNCRAQRLPRLLCWQLMNAR